MIGDFELLDRFLGLPVVEHSLSDSAVSQIPLVMTPFAQSAKMKARASAHGNQRQKTSIR
jgi:hypothetical protein